MLSVLFVVPDFMPGGAQKQCALLYSQLSRRNDLKISLAYLRGGDNYKWITHGEGDVVCLPRENFKDPRIVWDLLSLVKSKKVDLVVSWLHPADTYCWLLKLICPSIFWVMTERDSSYPNSWKYKLRNFFGVYSDAIVANSRAGFKYWLNIINDESSLFFLPNMVNFPIGLKLDESLKIVDFATMGRLEEQKNPILVCAAMLNLPKEFNSVIAGSGSLEGVIEKYCAQSTVTFSGYEKNPDSLLAKTKVFVTMSKHEGMPNALVEAVRSSCVVVASDIPEHLYFLGNDYPFLVRLDSSQSELEVAMQSAIKYANSEVCDLQNLYSNAYLRMQEMTPEAVSLGFFNLFIKVLNDEKN